MKDDTQQNLQPNCNQVASDCISRQAAIKAADSIIERDTSGNNDVVKAMTAWKEYIKELPSAQPGWIPVTERLPEEDTEVLVTVYFMGLKQTSPSGWNDHIKPSYYVDLASRIGDDWSSASDEYKIARDRHKVVAWQPKPQPWEGGQDGWISEGDERV